MAVVLMADGSIDLTPAEQQQLNVFVQPMTYSFGDDQLRQGEMPLEAFYDRLRTCTQLPKTSQVNPYEFAAFFEPPVRAGDDIVLFALSSSLSGTYQSACTAAAQFEGGPIHIIDTKTVTLGAQVLLRHAVKLRDAGATAQEIVAAVEALKKRVILIAIINETRYLYLGGRLSAVGSKMTGVLNLKPIVIVDAQSGAVKPLGVVRGMKRGKRWFADYAQKAGIDPLYPVVFGHAHNLPQLLDAEATILPDQHGYDVYRVMVGEVLGANIGADAYGMAFIRRDR